MPRPVSLKNASIDAIRAFAPGAAFGPVVRETTKGSVAHVRPPVDAVRRSSESALPARVVLPRFVAGAEARLEPLPKARAFMRLIDNAFNYNVHGRAGFDLLGELVDRCDCHEFSYGNLSDAVAVFERLAAGDGGASP